MSEVVAPPEVTSLVAELRRRLDEKAAKNEKFPNRDKDAEAHVQRVQKDFGFIDPRCYGFSEGDAGRAIEKLIEGLNASLAERGEEHRYLRVGDEVALGGKQHRVVSISLSIPILSAVETGSRRSIVGTNLYDNPASKQEFLPLVYLFEEIT